MLCLTQNGFSGPETLFTPGNLQSSLWDNPHGLKRFLDTHCLVAGLVDAATGEVVVRHTDVTIPSQIPFLWPRCYQSHRSQRGWHTPADSGLRRKADHIVFTDIMANRWRFGLPDKKCGSSGENGARLESRDRTLWVTLRSGHRYVFNDVRGAAFLPARIIYFPDGNRLSLERNERGLKRLTTRTGQILYALSEAGKLLALDIQDNGQTHSRRSLARYLYDDDGNLTCVYDALQIPVHLAYENGLLRRIRGRRHEDLCFDYAAENGQNVRCLRVHLDGRDLFRFEYDRDKTTAIDALGGRTTYRFDQACRLISVQNACGGTGRIVYDQLGRITSVASPSGSRTTYRYLDDENIVQVKRPGQRPRMARFNANGRLVSLRDDYNRSRHWQFDENDRLVAYVSAEGLKETQTFSRDGGSQQITDARGGTRRLECETFGRPRKVIDADRRETTFFTDAQGVVHSLARPDGETIDIEYDEKYRVKSLRFPRDKRVSYAYDHEDNPVMIRDPAGTLRIRYNSAGQPIDISQPDAGRTAITYDPAFRIVRVENREGEALLFERDQNGRIVRETDNLGNIRSYAYDADGRLAEFTDPEGTTTLFSYDDAGRLVERRANDGATETFTYTDDGSAVILRNDKTLSMQTYDMDHRLVSDTCGYFDVDNTYDGNSRRIERTSSLGNTIRYSYDPCGRLSGLSVNRRDILTIARDASGRTVEEKAANAVLRRYDYDAHGRLSRQRLSVLDHCIHERRYQYAQDGRTVVCKDSLKGDFSLNLPPAVNTLLRFLEDRFAAAPSAGRAEDLPEEDIGCRAFLCKGARYRFDRRGHLVERRNGTGLFAFNWDAFGRLFDALLPGANHVAMNYDPLGRRVMKKRGPIEQFFGWDGANLLCEQIDGHFKEYIFHPDTGAPLGWTDENKQICFFNNDLLGNPQEVFDENGVILWSALYTPDGCPDRLHTYDIDNHLRRNAGYDDPDTDLCLRQNRFFDRNLEMVVSGPAPLRDELDLKLKSPMPAYNPLGLFMFSNNAQFRRFGRSCNDSMEESTIVKGP